MTENDYNKKEQSEPTVNYQTADDSNQEPVTINVKDFIRETDEEGYWYATK